MGWVVNATPRPLYPLGKTGYPLYRRLGVPQGQSGLVGRISPLTGIPRTVQPVGSRYTDCAIPAPWPVVLYKMQFIIAVWKGTKKKCVEEFTVEVSRGVLNHIIMSFPPVSDRVFKKAKITKSMNIAAVMCWTYKCSEMFVSITTRACSLLDADVGQGRNNNERE